MLSIVKRKLMLLNHRLHSLKGQDLGKGRLVIEPGAQAHWLLQLGPGNEGPTFSTTELAHYAAGANKYGRKKMVELNKFAVAVFPGPWGTDHPIDDDSVTTTRFGQLLGLEQAQVRYIIDREFAANFPMLSSLQQSPRKAERFCSAYSGCYFMYRYDTDVNGSHSNGSGILLRSTLCIRYPTPQKSYMSKSAGNSSVRVRLNIPAYRDRKFSIYKYDGLVRQRTGSGKVNSERDRKWWTWLLQGRFGDNNRHLEDIIMMFSEAPSPDEQLWMRGMMLTQCQDKEHTPTYSPIILFRVEGYSLTSKLSASGETFQCLDPDETEFMKTQPASLKVAEQSSLSDTDYAALTRLIEILKSGSPLMR